MNYNPQKFLACQMFTLVGLEQHIFLSHKHHALYIVINSIYLTFLEGKYEKFSGQGERSYSIIIIIITTLQFHLLEGILGVVYLPNVGISKLVIKTGQTQEVIQPSTILQAFKTGHTDKLS